MSVSLTQFYDRVFLIQLLKHVPSKTFLPGPNTYTLLYKNINNLYRLGLRKCLMYNVSVSTTQLIGKQAMMIKNVTLFGLNVKRNCISTL